MSKVILQPNGQLKASDAKMLNQLDEHDALHMADQMATQMLGWLDALTELHALDSIIAVKEIEAIYFGLKNLHAKLTAAHTKWEGKH
jgi:hypothetical protein